MLFEISSGPDPSETDQVWVSESHLGKGVYATHNYPDNSVIGEIKGALIPCGSGPVDYTFEFDERADLEPAAPFRFLNHSCNPNCEVEFERNEEQEFLDPGIFLIALRDIYTGEALTIDYNWPATHAIRCQCREPTCRGWVVAEEELEKVTANCS